MDSPQLRSHNGPQYNPAESPYSPSAPGWAGPIQQSTTNTPASNPKHSSSITIESVFIDRFFHNIPEQSAVYIHVLPSMPSHIITSIQDKPQLVTQWREFRAQHLHAMIEPLSQMFGLRDNRLLTDMTSWLKHTWVFELGFLQSAHETDPNAFYPMSCPIYGPSCPKKKQFPPPNGDQHDRIPRGDRTR